MLNFCFKIILRHILGYTLRQCLWIWTLISNCDLSVSPLSGWSCSGVMWQAEKDQLLAYELHIDEKDKPHISSYFDEIQHLYHRVSPSISLSRLSAHFTEFWMVVKVDLTGWFDENLVICVSPTFIWLSTWHKFHLPVIAQSTRIQQWPAFNSSSQSSTLLRSNRVAFLVAW